MSAREGDSPRVSGLAAESTIPLCVLTVRRVIMTVAKCGYHEQWWILALYKTQWLLVLGGWWNPVWNGLTNITWLRTALPECVNAVFCISSYAADSIFRGHANQVNCRQGLVPFNYEGVYLCRNLTIPHSKATFHYKNCPVVPPHIVHTHAQHRMPVNCNTLSCVNSRATQNRRKVDAFVYLLATAHDFQAWKAACIQPWDFAWCGKAPTNTH